MQKKKHNGTAYAAIKLDMSKAFGRVSWNFLLNIIEQMGFPKIWLRYIGQCIQTMKYAINFNGNVSPYFTPNKGLRQACPLSPFLFILTQHAFSSAPKSCFIQNQQLGIKIAKNAPTLSHLMYADDCILFTKATTRDIVGLANTLNACARFSDQRINFQKSAILLSLNTPAPAATFKTNTLHINKPFFQGKYLGLSLDFSQSKSLLFAQRKQHLQKKLHTWKLDLLSLPGRITLAKHVLSAIPQYVLGIFKLPFRVADSLD